jgi:hypothetical protein
LDAKLDVSHESFRIIWKLFATLGQLPSLLQGYQGQSFIPPAKARFKSAVTRLNRIRYGSTFKQIFFVGVGLVAGELPLFRVIKVHGVGLMAVAYRAICTW